MADEKADEKREKTVLDRVPGKLLRILRDGYGNGGQTFEDFFGFDEYGGLKYGGPAPTYRDPESGEYRELSEEHKALFNEVGELTVMYVHALAGMKATVHDTKTGRKSIQCNPNEYNDNPEGAQQVEQRDLWIAGDIRAFLRHVRRSEASKEFMGKLEHHLYAIARYHMLRCSVPRRVVPRGPIIFYTLHGLPEPPKEAEALISWPPKPPVMLEAAESPDGTADVSGERKETPGL